MFATSGTITACKVFLKDDKTTSALLQFSTAKEAASAVLSSNMLINDVRVDMHVVEFTPDRSTQAGGLQGLVDELVAKINDRKGLEAVAKLFHLLDTDDSGELDLDEFHAGLRQFGMRVSANDAQAMLKSFDTDGNGSLNIAEFMAIAKLELEVADLQNAFIAKGGDAAHQKLSDSERQALKEQQAAAIHAARRGTRFNRTNSVAGDARLQGDLQMLTAENMLKQRKMKTNEEVQRAVSSWWNSMVCVTRSRLAYMHIGQNVEVKDLESNWWMNSLVTEAKENGTYDVVIDVEGHGDFLGAGSTEEIGVCVDRIRLPLSWDTSTYGVRVDDDGIMFDAIGRGREQYPSARSPEPASQASGDFCALAGVKRHKSQVSDEFFALVGVERHRMHPGFLRKDDYIQLFVALQRNLLPDLDESEALDTAADEWQNDLPKGMDRMDYSAFYDAVFQLVDTWTNGYEVQEFESQVNSFHAIHAELEAAAEREVQRLLEEEAAREAAEKAAKEAAREAARKAEEAALAALKIEEARRAAAEAAAEETKRKEEEFKRQSEIKKEIERQKQQDKLDAKRLELEKTKMEMDKKKMRAENRKELELARKQMEVEKAKQKKILAQERQASREAARQRPGSRPNSRVESSARVLSPAPPYNLNMGQNKSQMPATLSVAQPKSLASSNPAYVDRNSPVRSPSPRLRTPPKVLRESRDLPSDHFPVLRDSNSPGPWPQNQLPLESTQPSAGDPGAVAPRISPRTTSRTSPRTASHALTPQFGVTGWMASENQLIPQSPISSLRQTGRSTCSQTTDATARPRQLPHLTRKPRFNKSGTPQLVLASSMPHHNPMMPPQIPTLDLTTALPQYTPITPLVLSDRSSHRMLPVAPGISLPRTSQTARGSGSRSCRHRSYVEHAPALDSGPSIQLGDIAPPATPADDTSKFTPKFKPFSHRFQHSSGVVHTDGKSSRSQRAHGMYQAPVVKQFRRQPQVEGTVYPLFADYLESPCPPPNFHEDDVEKIMQHEQLAPKRVYHERGTVSRLQTMYTHHGKQR
jgi:hypothetical protein